MLLTQIEPSLMWLKLTQAITRIKLAYGYFFQDDVNVKIKLKKKKTLRTCVLKASIGGFYFIFERNFIGGQWLAWSLS